MKKRWKELLRTPPESRRVKWILALTIVGAPVIVAAHFMTRLSRGDYPSEADSIGIPVFGYGLFVFPLTLIILGFSLYCYTPGAFLFAWSQERFGRSLLWTLVSTFPVGYSSLLMILDGLEGRIYWTSAFFLLHAYCLLVLRASLLAYVPPVPST